MSNVFGPIGPLSFHAKAYAEQGLEVFPLKADKAPGTRNGFKDATIDPGQVDAWWETSPAALIGHRIAVEYVVLDIDPRHGGHETWLALKAELGGKLPLTRAHASGRGDGGIHVWWLRPGDRLTTRRLDEWARERGLGAPKEHGGWTSGIDLLTHDLRYTILPPSPHPLTGKPYYWLPGRGLEVEPAPMPVLLVELLTDDAPIPAMPAPRPKDPDSPADWYSDRTRWTELLIPAGWRVVAGDGDSPGSRWRHPSATATHSATIGPHGHLHVYTTSTAFVPVEPGIAAHGYTRFAAYALIHHGGDERAAARAIRQRMSAPIRLAERSAEHLLGAPVPPRAENPSPEAPRAPQEPVEAPEAPITLPDVVWDSRESLDHVRRAARARLVAPDAVLAAILARVAAITPHVIELTAPVGGPVGLTYYAAIVGPPSIGKSAAVSIAAELVPAPPNVLDRLPIGSGEGMVEVLYGTVPDPSDPKGKATMRAIVGHAAIFHVDEGQVIGDLSARQGTTLMPTLRSAWTNQPLGAANASADRRRNVPGEQYVYGITLGVQPELAGPLLSDTAGGTPQRFLWVSAVDPGMAAGTPWPGPLPWTPPEVGRLEDRAITRGGMRRFPLRVDPQIELDIVTERERVGRGGDVEVGDEHRMLLRFKTAALLALLEGRVDVNLEDWHLADLILDTSREVRRAVGDVIGAVKARAEDATVARLAHRELTVEGRREAKALESAARSAARKVHAHAEANEHLGDGDACSSRCIARTIAGKHRALVTVDEVLDEAVRNQWIAPVGGRWAPGPSRPA